MRSGNLTGEASDKACDPLNHLIVGIGSPWALQFKMASLPSSPDPLLYSSILGGTEILQEKSGSRFRHHSL